MVDHKWLADVLGDLAEYCSKNDLGNTEQLVLNAKRVFEAELRAMKPSKMTLENHLALVNQRPI